MLDDFNFLDFLNDRRTGVGYLLFCMSFILAVFVLDFLHRPAVWPPATAVTVNLEPVQPLPPRSQFANLYPPRQN